MTTIITIPISVASVDVALTEAPRPWVCLLLLQYLKVGNATCTTIALVGLKECGMQQEVCQLALKMVGGLEVLLNILRTSNLRCNVSNDVISKLYITSSNIKCELFVANFT